MSRFILEGESNEILAPIGYLFNEYNGNSTQVVNFVNAMEKIKQQISKGKITEFGTIDVFNELSRSAKESAMLKMALFQEGDSNNMSIDHLSSLQLYTMQSPYYGTVNRRFQAKDRNQIIPFTMSIWLLLESMKFCPVFAGVQLFRGMKGVDLSNKYQVEEPQLLVTWYQFSSCSVSVESALEFTDADKDRTLFCITMLSGAHSTGRARCISKYSYFDHEEEVLVPPCTKFRVTGRQTDAKKLTTIYLSEVPPSDPIVDFRTADQIQVIDFLFSLLLIDY